MKPDMAMSWSPRAGPASSFSRAENGGFTPDLPCSGDDYLDQVLDTLERSGSVSRRHGRGGPLRSRGRRRTKRLSKRGLQVMEVVARWRIARHDQIHLRLWDGEADSYSQSLCTALVRDRWLDVLPRPHVSAPAVYLISPKARQGTAWLRETYGEARARKLLSRLGSVPHLLEITEVRLRIEKACEQLGWSLRFWLRSEDLLEYLPPELIPDGYCQIQREENGQVRTAGFFLELQRANRQTKVVASKLQRYHDLYRSGRYEQVFATPALRVLFVFTSDTEVAPTTRVRSGLSEARRIGATFARFATLQAITQLPASGLLIEPIWLMAGRDEPVALFDV
jgi:hypothetical protein